MPVAGAAEGQEVKGSLEGQQWACFALKFPWARPDDPWNFLTVMVTKTSEGGDPDLFGIFTGGSRGVGGAGGRAGRREGRGGAGVGPVEGRGGPCRCRRASVAQ